MSAEVSKKIETEEQYLETVEKIESLWESKEGTAEHQALMTLMDLVHEYEGTAAEELLTG